MTLSPAVLSSLLDDLYAAMDSQAMWQRFLERLCSHCGCERAFLIVAAVPEGPNRDGVDKPGEHSFATQWIPRLAATGNVESIFWDQPNAHCRYLPATIGTNLLRDSIGFALRFPSAAHRYDFSAGEEAAPVASQSLALLKPHLRRLATHVNLNRCNMAPDPFQLAGCLDLFDAPVIGMDAHGTVVACTEAVNAVLRSGGLKPSEGGLSAVDPSEEPALRQQIHSALAIARGSALKGDKSRCLQYSGAALFSREGLPALGAVFAAVQYGPASAPGAPSVLIFLCDSAKTVSSRAKLLRTLYRLSPTELRLVDELVSGRRLKDAAQELRLTENTARFHLKEIFRKMSVNCQVDLLRAVLAMPGIGEPLGVEAPEVAGERRVPAARRESSARETDTIFRPESRDAAMDFSQRSYTRREERPALKARPPQRSAGELRLMRLLASM